VYFIWANANESWGYEYVYPQFNRTITKLITKSQTVGWKTYRDDGYGFTISHPAKYSGTVSTVVASSALGNYPGTSVGPLIFVKADTSQMKALAQSKFNVYWNYKSKIESPTDYCSKGIIENTNLDIRVASCVKGNVKSNFAIINGKNIEMFVDGSTSGGNKALLDAYGNAGSAVSQTEFVQILSTFKFN
jgi:hypothetical protein